MNKEKVLNETIKETNKKHGEKVIKKANEIKAENVKTPTDMLGGNNNYCPSFRTSISHMDTSCQVRNLKEEEIECKVLKVKEEGVSLLLYKTARTDALILDETFGKMNWQCEYKEIKQNLYCGISVFNYEQNQWITKWDCGIESAYGDKAKGEASDAFKRAGFKWGIGTELYTSPHIWIPNTHCTIKSGKCNDDFIVEKILIENKKIAALSIKNVSKNNKRVFVWQKNKQGVLRNGHTK